MRKILTATLAAGLLTAGAVHAATTTTTFAVTATVNSTCATTATALAFPAYTPGAGAVTQSSTVSVKCTKNTPYTVLLNGGVGGTVAQRAMTSGGNTLQYQLYTTVGLGHGLGRRHGIERHAGGRRCRRRDREHADGLRPGSGQRFQPGRYSGELYRYGDGHGQLLARRRAGSSRTAWEAQPIHENRFGGGRQSATADTRHAVACCCPANALWQPTTMRTWIQLKIFLAALAHGEPRAGQLVQYFPNPRRVGRSTSHGSDDLDECGRWPGGRRSSRRQVVAGQRRRSTR